MSSTSSTVITAYPYEMADVELKKVKIWALDASSEKLTEFDHEWKSTNKGQEKRIDLREKYDNYRSDPLYSVVNELKISVTFEVDTSDCIQSKGQYTPGIHLSSPMSRYEIYKCSDPENKENGSSRKIAIELTLDEDQVKQLRGNITLSPIVILSSSDKGTPPVKKSKVIFATANGSILSRIESTNQFTILFDDSNPPTSSGMDIEWRDMKDEKNALYSLSYPEGISVDEPIRVKLVLNKKSALYALSKVSKGSNNTTKKKLNRLMMAEIVCSIQTDLLSDLTRKLNDEMLECRASKRVADSNSGLEYAMDVLRLTAKQTKLGADKILEILQNDQEEKEKITLKLQDSKKYKSKLDKLYSAVANS